MAASNLVSGLSLLTADIDVLFEKFTIEQLHEIEQNVRCEIEKKKEDVRIMVGERYRDLIEAADTIAEMKTSISTVTEHITSMEDQILKLEEKMRIIPKVSRQMRKQNYSINTIHSLIWSLIENNQILLGSELFLLAKHIHNSLQTQSSFNVPVSNWFPVITRQWITTSHFKTSLIDVSKNTLKDHNVDAEILAQCFTVLLVLNNSTVSQVFDEFLRARLECIQEIFYPDRENSKLKHQNCQIVHLIANTLHLTYALFVDDDGNGELLEKTKKNMFSSQNFSSRFQTVNLSHHFLAVKNNLPDVDCKFRIDELREKCTEWIEKVKAKVREELSQVITFIKSINGLSIIRDTVADVINKKNENEKWNTVCGKLLRNDLQMWEDIFEPLFLNQMKSIVDYHIGSAFTRIRNDLLQFTENSLSDQKMYEIEQDVASFIWTESASDLPLKINWHSSKNQVSFSNLMLKARGFTPFCEMLCTHLNEDLALLIEDIAHFKGHEENLEENMTLFLRTSTQQQIDILLRHCEKLNRSENCSSDQIITRILSLARFLVAITELSPMLQICIKGLQKDKVSFRRDSNVVIDANWENQKIELITHANKLLRKWKEIVLNDAVNSLRSILKGKTLGDSLLHLPKLIRYCFLVRQLWDTIDIQEENEDGKLVSSVIRIPGQASWTLVKILHSVCLEINKAAPHFLPREILQEMQADILERILTAYEENTLVSDSISQVAALQLLFDVNFISNLMSAKDDKVLAARIVKLTEFIESHVDPFDLDVFSPYIQVNLKKCVQRASVILGALVNPSKTNAFLSMARISLSQNEQHNILSLNPSIPHFSLLPLANNNL
uniref:Conserved oligomeric Golgi complex subunit 1 n=1 Tax=Strigamia maritima TaxID=126957 RepID=T1JDY8_STRMM